MRCSKAVKLISQYFDGECTPEEKGLFEAHIHDCADCSIKLGEIRSVRASFAQAQHYRAPSGFTMQVRARIRDGARERLPFMFAFTRFAAAVIVLIIIGLGILTGSIVGLGGTAGVPYDAAAYLYLDIFKATPPGSPGGAYLAMMEGPYEK